MKHATPRALALIRGETADPLDLRDGEVAACSGEPMRYGCRECRPPSDFELDEQLASPAKPDCAACLVLMDASLEARAALKGEP